MSEDKAHRLGDSLLYAQFTRDCAEAEDWIEEKLKTATEESFSSATDLTKKMRMLKKHQAFEAEIVANTDRIKNIKQVGKFVLLSNSVLD